MKNCDDMLIKYVENREVGLLGFEKLSPRISPSSSVPELITFAKHAFRERDFVEVQDILMERERKMRIEMENCDAVNVELSKEIEEMRSKILEYERMEGVYEVKFKDWGYRIENFVKEFEELRDEKLEAEETIKELKGRQVKADKTIEELRKRNLEAGQVLEELRAQKLEADKAARLYKRRFEDLQPRIVRLEEKMVKILCSRENDLLDKGKQGEVSAFAEGKEANFPNSKGGKECSGNGDMQAGRKSHDADINFTSRGVLSASDSSGSEHSGSPEEGGGSLFESSGPKENVVDAVQASDTAECNNDIPQANDQENENKRPQGSGAMDDKEPILPNAQNGTESSDSSLKRKRSTSLRDNDIDIPRSPVRPCPQPQSQLHLQTQIPGHYPTQHHLHPYPLKAPFPSPSVCRPSPALPFPRMNCLPPLLPCPTALPFPRMNWPRPLLPCPTGFLNRLPPQSPYPVVSLGYQHPLPISPGFPFSSMGQSGILGPRFRLP